MTNTRTAVGIPLDVVIRWTGYAAAVGFVTGLVAGIAVVMN